MNLLSVSSLILVVVKFGLAPDITDWSSAFTSAIDASSLSINAPAEVTFVVSVTSADASIPSSLVLSPSTKAPSVGLTWRVEIVTPFTPARSVNSESINAPAAVTLAVSVTSALASIASNLVLSPSTKAPSVGLT